MNKVLFVFPASPLATNFSGAASRYVQSFHALVKLFDEVHVVRIGNRTTLESAQAFEQSNPEAMRAHLEAASWQEFDYSAAAEDTSRLRLLKDETLDPIRVNFPMADSVALKLSDLIAEIDPTLIWAEHIEPAAAMSRMSVSVPWIFSNHDLAHRIRKIRTGGGGLREQWRLSILQRAERQIVMAADTIVTGSTKDNERLQALGHSSVFTIPMAYDSNTGRDLNESVPKDLNIVHLGSLETTANRVGLEGYLQKAHDQVVAACERVGVTAKLVIIGDASQVKEPLAGLLNKPNIEIKGFVPDLDSALRPFDISILPYEHDSGYRTKLPLLMSHGQVIVATQSAVAGTQMLGLRSACVITDSLESFPNEIGELAASPDKRELLGHAARQFFETNFTYHNMIAPYQEVLEDVRVKV